MEKQYFPVEYQASIAWFKLSELVGRGEKERAFSIYRLLIHALNDDAYAAQLKGDLWFSFQEYDRAREAYYNAIAWYDLSERFLQSAFVHERLLLIDRDSLSLLITIIRRFAELSFPQHVLYYLTQFTIITEKQDQMEQLISSLHSNPCSQSAQTLIQTQLKKLQKETPTGIEQSSLKNIPNARTECF